MPSCVRPGFCNFGSQLLLKASLVFFFVYLLLSINVTAKYTSQYFWLCIALIPIPFIIYAIGMYGIIYRESKAWASAYIVLKAATFFYSAYVLFIRVSNVAALNGNERG